MQSRTVELPGPMCFSISALVCKLYAGVRAGAHSRAARELRLELRHRGCAVFVGSHWPTRNVSK
jgi:hypothetical protein